jgi:hypothetical protein
MICSLRRAGRGSIAPMEYGEDDLFDDPELAAVEDELESFDDDFGEDHRGDNPGFDLDEQVAIEELEDEQGE